VAVVITAADRQEFKRCRRAWDFGSRLRQGWEPDGDPAPVDPAAAVRAALAVWYFPGMWEWGREIVRPLAIEAHRRVTAGWPAEHDLVVVDPFNAYWAVEHCIGDSWAAPDALLLDEAGAAWCWAWGRSYLGMDIAGVIYNELRTDGEFRRTQVSRGLAELERVRHKLGCEAHDMTRADVAVYPSPSWDRCSTCVFRPPCIALDTGADAEAVLEAGYRRRPPAQVQEGRLGGSTWSMGRGAAPPKFGPGPHPGR
jgi:hypothetical protein